MAQHETAICGTAESLWLSASDFALRVRQGEMSSHDLVEAHVRHIEAINPLLNVMVVDRFAEALSEAQAADTSRARGEPMGPLHGIPISIKDQFEVAGMPATWGLPSRANERASADGPLVSRLRRAGAIILGKTNVPQMLAYNESDNPLYGRTSNPWNRDRTPGGSSGGEACLVSAGGSALGLGSDLGGSIRLPTHFCGVVGLKPTAGRLTNLDSPSALYPYGQEAIVMQTGPIARSVQDVALAMRVLAAPGQQDLDCSIAPVAWEDDISPAISGLRIAVYTDDGFFPAAPAVRRAVREAADALRGQGALVEEWTPPDVPGAMRIFGGLLAAQSRGYIARSVQNDPCDARLKGFLQLTSLPNALRPIVAAAMRWIGQPSVAEFVAAMRQFSADALTQLVADRAHYRTRFLRALHAQAFDALICPPHALPALTHGGSRYLMSAGSYSFLYNLLGMPAGVVPATRVRPGEESDRAVSRDLIVSAAHAVEMGSAGLPIGVQVVSYHWRESVVLRVMAALEQHFRAQPDYPLRPPLPV